MSAVALDILRAEFDLPIIGVIEPGARRRAFSGQRAGKLEHEKRRRIGVLGTTGMVLSGAYPRAGGQLSTRYEVVALAAPLLVPLTEEGWIEGEVPRLVVRRYVEPLIAAGASVIVLGCTHFPLLKGLIAEAAAEFAGHTGADRGQRRSHGGPWSRNGSPMSAWRRRPASASPIVSSSSWSPICPRASRSWPVAFWVAMPASRPRSIWSAR